MGNLLRNRLQAGLVIFDGAMGTEIYRRNFFVNASYEQLNLTQKKIIAEIHRSYIEAGADVLTTNTFNANARRLGRFGLADQTGAINRAGVAIAREAAGENTLVAGSIGPIGDPETPGDTRSRTELLREQIEALSGADFILFESLRTRTDLAAVLEAVKDFPDLEYVPSFAIEPPLGHAGETVEEFMRIVNAAAVPSPAAIGLNCGAGPENMLLELEKLVKLTKLPVIVQPNAGAPRGIDGRMLYMTSAEYFSTYAKRFVDLGAAAVGGCCGITPEHIAELVRTIKPLAMAEKRHFVPVEVKELALPDPVPAAERSRFGRKLAAGEFVTSIEITPPRGFDLTKTIAGAARCREAGVDAVNLPDGPRASARITPLLTALAIEREAGIETIPHCCCRDRSLIGLQAELLSYAGAGIHNILFITGDPPKLGDYPFSSGVFDTDSIGMVKIQARMNQGIDLGGQPLNAQSAILIGVGADPSAVDQEREYRRTCEKVEAGANFIITQTVFAAKPLTDYLKRIEHLHVPVIAGIWPLTSLRNAQFMRSEVPGVTVPDRVIERMAAADGKEAQRACGVAIAREILAEVRPLIQGVQVNAPFGNVEIALEVLQK